MNKYHLTDGNKTVEFVQQKNEIFIDSLWAAAKKLGYTNAILFDDFETTNKVLLVGVRSDWRCCQGICEKIKI